MTNNKLRQRGVAAAGVKFAVAGGCVYLWAVDAQVRVRKGRLGATRLRVTRATCKRARPGNLQVNGN